VDNSTLRWSTHPGLVVIGWVLAVGAAVAAVAASGSADRPGTLLFGLGAVALTLAAAYGTFVRPRLAADAAGVRIRSLGGTQELAWDAVRMELTTVRRWGREAPVLEFEALAAEAQGSSGDNTTSSGGEGLTVLGWVELGADPRDVHDALLALRG